MAVTPALGACPQTLTFDAASTGVTLQVVAPPELGRAALGLARASIEGVEAACSSAGPLQQVNAEPDEWHEVPPPLYLALERAARVHELTGGLVDPRVRAPGADPTRVGPWHPAFDPEGLTVRLGSAVDLGGVGSALAVDLASGALAGAGDVHLAQVGTARRCAGRGPDGDGWRAPVDDPAGSSAALAVLRSDDRAVGTSTGHGPGLLAVTVLAADTVTAWAWSRALALAGADEAAELASAQELAALWVDDAHCLHLTPEAAARVLWLAPTLDVRDAV